MKVDLFDRDGSVREVHVPVASPLWPTVLGVISRRSGVRQFTMDGSVRLMPDSIEELLRVDGHARVLSWWVGGIECRTYFMDPEEFMFDYRPVDSAADTFKLKRFLDALASELGVPLRICHEHGDHAPVLWK